jgi:cytochrome c-type biogenesis protein CcmH
MMLTFVMVAGFLAAGAAALLLLPLMRRRDDARPAAGITAGILVCALLLGGGALYAVLSDYPWVETPAAQDTPASAAAALAKSLARKPDDLAGWMKLGRLYFDLEQYPLAIRAFQRADRLANGQNTEAIAGVAETMLAQDFENIRGPAGRMFERVLELEPGNTKALFYSALAAMGRGETVVARDRFQRMLAQNPPAQIRDIIQQQLQALDAMPTEQAGDAAAGDARIQVHVTVSPALRYQLSDRAVLFVAARDPNQPGPPFAAKRLPPGFPVDVTLTTADAMLPGRHISPGQKLEVVARISLNGQPQSSSGDPFGQVGYHVGHDGKLNIVIDKLAP